MKAWYRWCGPGALVLLLMGCGGESGNDAAEERPAPERQVAMPAEREAPPAAEVEPFGEPVVIEFSADLRSDRRLMVAGESNLPEGARLLIVVERELSGVRWQARTTLRDGHFAAGPFGPGSGLPDGGYTITVHLPEASVQPLEVRRRIGEEGEHLSGPLVGESRHGLGQVASTSRRFLIGAEPRRATDRVEVLTVE